MRAGLVAVLLAALAGCTGPLPSASAPPGGPSAVANAGTAVPVPTAEPLPQPATPPPVGKPVPQGPGAPPEGTDDGPYLPVPTAPAGNERNNEDAPTAGVHCIAVNYLSNKPSIPTGVHVIVTSVKITEGGTYFQKGGTGCGRPSCDNFVWADSGDTCDVPVTEKRSWSDDQRLTLLVGAKVDCGTADPAECADFADKARQVGQPLTIGGIQSSKNTESPATETTATETAGGETAGPTETAGATEDPAPTSTASAGS